MPEIKIKVRDKCAEGEGVIICNNSDYTVVWDLDSEWEPYSTRTMRVNLADGTYQDAVFTGNSAPLPVLTASGWVSVGLYAGDLHTSRAARLLALSSVLTPVGSPAAPAEDVYAQIMAKLNELSTVSPEDIAKAVEDYLAEHPIEETDPTVPEWAKADITGATVGQIAKIAAVDASGVPTAWEPVDMPSGGGGLQWIEVVDITTEEQTQKLTISVDKDGRPISQYNALWMVFSILFPADASQTSTNGTAWTYPFPKIGDNSYRYIAFVSGWKTVTRTLTYAWAGLPRLAWSSAMETQMIFDTDGDPDFLSGLCVYLSSSGHHIPVGTRVRIAVLSKGVTA